MTFTFVSIYLLGNQSKAVFIVMMCGDSCRVVVRNESLLTTENRSW